MTPVAYIPVGRLSAAQTRIVMFGGAVMWIPSGIALMATTPFGRFTAIGAFLALGGLALLWGWWPRRPTLHGRARRLRIWGASLSLATAALAESAAVLFFNSFPDLALCAAVAASTCLILRVVVGLRTRAAKTEDLRIQLTDVH